MNMKKTFAAFLDRDGVINLDFGHVGNPEEIIYVKGAFKAVRMLNNLNFYVFIVSNQAGIGKGKYTYEDYLECIEKIKKDFADEGAVFNDIRYCPYHEEAIQEKYRVKDHPFRKPNPGMLLDLEKTWNIDMKNSFLIGDKQSDLLAARAAGINGYLFDENDCLETFVKKVPEVSLQVKKMKKDLF